MTGAAPARRLLARLIDEQAIETEPIAEVRTDLAALGIDPARAIALSRRLAADAHSPAAALLRRIADSEDDDDEIRRLEQMDIGAVRQGLPQGATAATAGRARRAAGIDSNVVDLRRRRSRRLLYGLSGVAAAMAASLVFYVGLSNNQPFRFQAPHEASPTPAASQPVTPPAELEGGEFRLNAPQLQYQPPAAEADTAKSELADVAQQQRTGGNIQAANEPAASGTQSAAQSPSFAIPTTGTDEAHPVLVPPRGDEQASADAVDMQRRRETLIEELEKATAASRLQAELSEQSDQLQPVDLVSGATGAATASTPPAVPPLPAPEMTIIPRRKPEREESFDLAARTTDSATAASAAKEQAGETTERGLSRATASPTEPPAAPFGLAHPVAALLIVDPGLVPAALQQKDYPVGGLPARLGDARRLAGGRQVAALVTMQVEGRTVDAIVLAGAAHYLGDRYRAASPSSTTLGPVLPGYDLIELDRR
jgi:hypothetical protein